MVGARRGAENWRRTSPAFDPFGMRSGVLAAVLLLALGSGCATRARPYRFASPLLGSADVPAEALPGEVAESRGSPGSRSIATRRAAPRRVGGWQADAQHGPIRTVSARGIEAKMPVASAEAAAEVAKQDYAQAAVWSRLPAPHQGSSVPAQAGGVTGAITIPRVREPSDLRGLVGQRDKRDPLAIALAWLEELGIATDAYPTDGPTLVTWAQTAGKLAVATEIAKPGDLLVFDRATSDEGADLFAIVIGRDARGVTEFMYAGNGVIRRGFLDPVRPSIRRDLDGGIVNTFIRHGKRFPPRGTRYLAGELIAYVIHTR
jgi:hypothetical protein